MDHADYNKYKSWENCEYCHQPFDVIDLHELMLRGHKARTVLRCEQCREDMKQYVVSK